MNYSQIYNRIKPWAVVSLMVTLLLLTFSVSLASPTLFGKSTLGDFVWYDINGDGLKGANEPGINGVLIKLYRDVNNNNQIDLGDQLITSTVTANDVGGIGDDTGGNKGPGFYDFSVDGGAGIVYIVEVDASNFAPGGPLEDYVYSGENATQPYNGPQPRVVPYPENPDDKNNVDFPFYKMSLGNLVWEDFNNDGNKDPNEPGLNNVPVALVDASTGQVVDTTVTSNGGWYTFTQVIAGTYVVSVTPPAGYLSSTGPNQEADPDANGDENDNGLDTPVNGAIVSAPFNMQPNDAGAQNNNVLDPTQASTHNPTIDFGLIKNFDLALVKRVHANQPKPIQPGQDVTFTITVLNQGDFAAANVTVVDYIPSGFTLSPLETDWSGGPTGTVSHILASTLAAHSQTSVDIILRVNNPLTPGSYTNVAEIASATDQNGNPVVDVDSTPDSTSGNDGTPKDDVVNEDHKTNPNDDEDDQDPANFVVDLFDLALIKRLGVGQPSAVLPGADVRFTVEIRNQGTLTATNIELIDYIPSGFSLSPNNSANWTDGGSTATYASIASLPPSGVTTVDVMLRVDALATTGTYTNVAEIKDATDPNGNPISDIDSTPEDAQQNGAGDTFTTDDGVAGNGKTGGDEDDHDPATVNVGNVFDLALRKTLAPGQASSIKNGDDITFTITVFNQGTLIADNIVLVDYLPTGFTLSASEANWTSSGGMVTRTLVGQLAPNNSTSVTIRLTASNVSAAGTYTNIAEIKSATDDQGTPQTDVDSTPEDTQGNGPNDTYVTNDDVNGNGLAGGDEDDSDPEPFRVEIFDLALTKSLQTSQAPMIRPGQDATFTITIFNQGSIPASNIVVVDYVPTGFSLSPLATGWSGSGPITRVISGPLAPQTSTQIDVVLRANSPLVSGNYVNVAEIQSATDPNGNPVTDIDSTPDANSTNDGTPKDNVTNENHKANPTADEDDHDPESIRVVNPSIVILKKLNTPQPIRTGDPISFTLTITNTGDVTATAVSVFDNYDTLYLQYVNSTPASVDNNNDGRLDWTDITIPLGDMAPGDTVKIDVNFTGLADTSKLGAQQPCMETGATCNVAGIGSATGFVPGLPPIAFPPAQNTDEAAIINPTAVSLVNRKVQTGANGTTISWSTVTENDMLGFNIRRTTKDGEPVQINTEMIPAQHAGQSTGDDYSYMDAAAVNGVESAKYIYILDVLTLDGHTESHILNPPSDTTNIMLPLLFQ